LSVKKEEAQRKSSVNKAEIKDVDMEDK